MSSLTSPVETKESFQLAATAQWGRSEQSLIQAQSCVFPTPLTRSWRWVAWTLALLIPGLFYLGPALLLVPPFLYPYAPNAAILVLVLDIVLLILPIDRPWPALRVLFQLWYEPFSVRHNLANASLADALAKEELSIYAMHPHGVIPVHAFLWAAFCHQYMPHAYGVGSTTNAALRLPILRHVLGWLSTVSASRAVLYKVMTNHNHPRSLFILPGGVAEIFMAHPGRHALLARSRRGLMKLALQTGASLVPVYVFGANDLYHQLGTSPAPNQSETQSTTDNDGSAGASTLKNDDKKRSSFSISSLQERLSRTAQAGFTIFWGQYGTPMPFQVPLTIVLGDPIPPEVTTNNGLPTNNDTKRSSDAGQPTMPPSPTKLEKHAKYPPVENPTNEQVDNLLERYIDAHQRLFQQYKEFAGCPSHATLEVL